jgi:site-specific DNA-methyltransferase (adenine-specific)
MWIYGQGFPKSFNISKAIDKMQKPFEAQLWAGYHTALKPAFEPIILAMNPLDGTYARNALKYGVAGLNIDGSRIALQNEKQPTGSAKRRFKSNHYTEEKIYGDNKITSALGRFPANLILDEEAAQILDEQSGFLQSGKQAAGGHIRNTDKHRTTYRPFKGQRCEGDMLYGDSGFASRFFYCAKASKSERGEGNDHPTVKPLALIRYLCNLLKPPAAGIMLDPFMGSGSTLLECESLGIKAIGIDIGEHNCEIAVKRILARRNGIKQI